MTAQLSRERLEEIAALPLKTTSWGLQHAPGAYSTVYSHEIVEMARMLLAGMDSEPVAVIDKEGNPMTRAECNDDRVFAICCKVGTPLYAAPPAPVVSIDKVKLGEWLDSEIGGIRPEQYDFYVKSFYENVMPAPVAVHDAIRLLQSEITIWKDRWESLRELFREVADALGCDVKDNDAMLEEIAMLKAEPVTVKCPKCGGTGLADSGGVQPWGEPISVPCDCTITAAPEQE